MKFNLLRDIYASPPQNPIPVLPHELSDMCTRYTYEEVAVEYDVDENTIIKWLRDAPLNDPLCHSNLEDVTYEEYANGVLNIEDDLKRWEMLTKIFHIAVRGELTTWTSLKNHQDISAYGFPLYKVCILEGLRQVAWLLRPMDEEQLAQHISQLQARVAA